MVSGVAMPRITQGNQPWKWDMFSWGFVCKQDMENTPIVFEGRCADCQHCADVGILVGNTVARDPDKQNFPWIPDFIKQKLWVRMLLLMLSACHSIGTSGQLDCPMMVRDRIMTHLMKQLLGEEAAWLAVACRQRLWGSMAWFWGGKTQTRTKENDSTGDEIEIEQWRSSYQDRCKWLDRKKASKRFYASSSQSPRNGALIHVIQCRGECERRTWSEWAPPS